MAMVESLLYVLQSVILWLNGSFMSSKPLYCWYLFYIFNCVIRWLWLNHSCMSSKPLYCGWMALLCPPSRYTVNIYFTYLYVIWEPLWSLQVFSIMFEHCSCYIVTWNKQLRSMNVIMLPKSHAMLHCYIVTHNSYHVTLLFSLSL